MFGGMPPLTPVVRYIIIINAIVFLLDQVIGLDILAMYVPGSASFLPFQIISHMFMHGDIVHIVMNMLWVAIFGSMVEMVWGPRRFLFFYVACGLGAILLHMGVVMWQLHGLEQAAMAFEVAPTHANFLKFFVDHAMNMGLNLTPESLAPIEQQLINGDKSSVVNVTTQMKEICDMLRDNHRVVGASGCVFGIMVAFAFNFPNVQMGLMFLPFKMSSKTFVLLILITEVVRGMSNVPGDTTAHFAHLGGALLGTVLLLGWYGDLRKLK